MPEQVVCNRPNATARAMNRIDFSVASSVRDSRDVIALSLRRIPFSNCLLARIFQRFCEHRNGRASCVVVTERFG